VSGSSQQTVNLSLLASYEGSNPSLSTIEFAVVAQLVERVLGKDEVTGSIPVNGSRVCGPSTRWLAPEFKLVLSVLRSIPAGEYYIGIATDVGKRL
jgi:hypothetical protein